MSNVDGLVQRMSQARRELLAAAESVSAQQWRQRPAEACWSAAAVIAHLTQVQEAILQGARKVIASEPPPAPLWKRLHVPLKLAEWRLLKAKTPLPLDPAVVE